MTDLLPIARTDGPNTFQGTTTFTQSLRMIRKDKQTFQPIILADEEDLIKDPNDYVGIAIDYSNDGGFWVLAFDGKIQADLIQIGKGRPGCRGHIGICTTPLPETQLGIRDLVGSGVNISVSVYSDQTSLWLNGSAQHADRMVVERGDTPNSTWNCWHQGSGIWDWRIGWVPGSYDFGIYGGWGVPTSPDKPGMPWMIFNRDTGGKDVIRVISLFECLEITDLQAKVQALTERIIALEGSK